ncbi:hypothetical protein AMECASPLE_012718 [Ameca splendens]|uniref:Uncharacterized protein n=1 Tax=Ameca splendens TaxID=208324 RepID=A0ABV0ZKV9_9TELE
MDTISLSALIDSGCEQNLIDQSLVELAQIEVEPHPAPHQVIALQRKDASAYYPSNQTIGTCPLSLQSLQVRLYGTLRKLNIQT